MSYSDTTPTTFIKCALAWVLFAVCLPGGIAVRGASAQTDPALRPGQPEARLEALVRSMTLEEKLGQLTQFSAGQSVDQGPDVQKQKRDELHALIREGKVGSLLNAHGVQYINGLQRVAVEESRLHVPLLFANDVIHGYRTIFPIPLAEASSWDPGLVERAARVAAVEASAAGTHWTFAPMVDIARDPRWGRVAEGSGEDPYLGSLMAAARVRGFQGSDLAAADTILACAKHFAAYGAAEGGRDYNTVDISEQTLREVFLPPFRATVEAGAGSFMSGFNELNGVPATAHPLLLRRVLRGEWQFDGVVISDWTSITEMIAHGFVRDPAEAAQRALAAGVDVDMCSFAYLNHLGAALGRGAISPSAVDHGVRRVLRAKLSLNLFDRPYGDPKREKEVVLSSQNRAVARRVAARSIVLLKNEKAL
ncbi:MAG: glycosyl hydrolase, partial [bacterium]|nr:glycosyl hydrolase [bacterium]